MRSTAVQPELDLFLADLAFPVPGPMTSLRERVAYAVSVAARQNGGYVHSSWVRPLLGEKPGNWGHAYSALRSGHFLKGAFLPHGGPWYLPNGDVANRNAAKPERVYRLMKAIPHTWPAEGR